MKKEEVDDDDHDDDGNADEREAMGNGMEERMYKREKNIIMVCSV